MAIATDIIGIDWNNDGDYSDTGEDVTARVQAARGIKMTRGRDQIREIAPPMAGKLDLALDNTSRDYSRENSGGDLYGNLLPGRPVRLQRVFSAVTYNLWSGVLTDLIENPNPGQRTVAVPALGKLSKLRGKKLSTTLYASVRIDTALGYVLALAGFSATDYVLDTGKTTLTWWWLDEEDAFDAATALVASEGPGAALYEDGQGRIIFESRHYRLTTARSTTSQATLRDTGAEPLHSRPMAYNSGLKDIINSCSIETKVRTAKTETVFWSTTGSFTWAPNEVKTFYGQTSDRDPLTQVRFDMSGFLGGPDMTITSGTYGGANNNTSGTRIRLRITAGASGMTASYIRLRGKVVSVDETTTIQNSVSTTTSQGRYGVRKFQPAMRAEIPVTTAQDIADAIVGLYQEPRPTVSLTLKANGADARMTQALSREISDRITVVESQTGLNTDMYIERIDHRITSGGAFHETKFGCEKASGVEYLVWGTGLWGTAVWGF